MSKINDELFSMWPCCFCFSYGYIFSCCTMGLSFCFPNTCISEAKKVLLESIKKANEYYFNEKGLNLSYRSRWSTSWLEIEFTELSTINFSQMKDNKIIILNNQIN